LRIFIAALLPEEIKNHIACYLDSIKDRAGGVKWESSQKLHITLKFLGDIDEEKLSEVKDIVSSSILGRSKIKLTLSNFGGFPSLSRPRILHVGFGESRAIIDLQSNIDSQLSEVGFEKDEREFIPHVTIGRVKSKFKINPPLPMIEEKTFSIENIAVVQSFINNKGSEYKNLNVYKLK
jgi:2'-5' RNA ligase